MGIVLAALNSKYIHSNLAIRYLKAFVLDEINIELAEFTINQKTDEIAAEIFIMKPAEVGFSTYIWNIDQIIDICGILKSVAPEIRIFLGGPEVSYDPKEIMENNNCIDMIVYGEGEESFRDLVTGVALEDIKGLVYRVGSNIVMNPPRPLLQDLDVIPFPYTDEDDLENKIVYYEASRGCPFHCAFCLSSLTRGVRFFSIERVKRDLDILMRSKAKQVKFVDRTFNSNKIISNEIIKHIAARNPGMTSFHLEITAHLIDEEQLDYFKNLRKGLFQFEIGVQSTNDLTIEAIGRTTDFTKLREVSKTIAGYGNIHQHLDLIAGLPYEGYERFSKSFDDLFEIQPEKIQLGFLKLLKGSRLRIESGKHGYKFLKDPPYEILENNYISYSEIVKLKDIEKLIDIYYNEKLYQFSLKHFISNHNNGAFKFFDDFSSYWRSNGLYKKAHGRDAYYSVLLDFYRSKNSADFNFFNELLRFDYVSNIKGGGIAPCFGKVESIEVPRIHKLLKNKRLIDACMPNEYQSPVKELLKKVRFEIFNWEVMGALMSEPPYKSNEQKTVLMFYKSEETSQRSKVCDITEYYLEDWD